MTECRIGTQEEWQAERDALLKEEKELTRRNDELARKRRELPWVRVEDYSFETQHGTRSLAGFFDGRSQLRPPKPGLQVRVLPPCFAAKSGPAARAMTTFDGHQLNQH